MVRYYRRARQAALIFVSLSVIAIITICVLVLRSKQESIPPAVPITADRQRPIIYLANSLGFSKLEKRYLTPDFIKIFDELGCNVYEPFSKIKEKPTQSDTISFDFKIALTDKQAVKNADCIFAVINGAPPDDGVCFELGLAAAYGKPTFLFRDDFRISGESSILPVNPMLFAGVPEDKWKEHFYTSITQIKDKNKAFVKWVNHWKLHYGIGAAARHQPLPF